MQKNINKKVLYETIMKSVSKEIKKYINENHANLLSNIDADNDIDLDIETKSFNNIEGDINSMKIHANIVLFKKALKTQKISNTLKNTINDPNNFEVYKAIIKAKDSEHLNELIVIGQALLGDNGNFNWIDTSDITDMSQLFMNYKNFNGHIELWDVSNVTDMSQMFYNAESFNQPIGKWDVSSVESCDEMFGWAVSFDQDISEWSLYEVGCGDPDWAKHDFDDMFNYCYIDDAYKPTCIKQFYSTVWSEIEY